MTAERRLCAEVVRDPLGRLLSATNGSVDPRCGHVVPGQVHVSGGQNRTCGGETTNGARAEGGGVGLVPHHDAVGGLPDVLMHKC